MVSTFFDRIDHLAGQVGDGDLTVRTEFDQVYAKYQELRDDLHHPRGGQAHYVRDGLIVHADEWIGHLADRAITPDGSELRSGAIGLSERIAGRQEGLAPVEFVNLRRSGHPSVVDDGAVVYDRPPDVARLSEGQLKAQRRHGHDLDYGAEGNRPRGGRHPREFGL